MTTLICENVTYQYEKGSKVLEHITTQFETGKMYAILGASGSGKTTLLSLIGGLDMTPIENVKLTAKQDALPILKQLGLTEDEAKRNVMKLSGGQQQRVAIARTLVSNAPVILADEPTGNLDKDTAAEITGILKNCAHQMNKCVIIVTHSNDLVKQADTVFKLKKGRLLQI